MATSGWEKSLFLQGLHHEICDRPSYSLNFSWNFRSLVWRYHNIRPYQAWGYSCRHIALTWASRIWSAPPMLGSWNGPWGQPILILRPRWSVSKFALFLSSRVTPNLVVEKMIAIYIEQNSSFLESNMWHCWFWKSECMQPYPNKDCTILRYLNIFYAS